MCSADKDSLGTPILSVCPMKDGPVVKLNGIANFEHLTMAQEHKAYIVL